MITGAKESSTSRKSSSSMGSGQDVKKKGQSKECEKKTYTQEIYPVEILRETHPDIHFSTSIIVFNRFEMKNSIGLTGRLEKKKQNPSSDANVKNKFITVLSGFQSYSPG